MKKFMVNALLAITMLSHANAASYIIVEEGVSLPSPQATLFNGTPVDVTSTFEKSSKVMVKGFIDPSNPKNLYATKNLKLLLAQVNDASLIQKRGDKGQLEVKVANKYLVENADLAWEKSTDRFYEKCTKCHAAKVVKDHTMLEWEGLYESMKEFAKPTDDDSSHILRFLRAYAKDGILSE